ncbi:hypothetical protein BLNAU_10764 [Blattamonas nauphoetae]|uniref:Uncharacterized protein n=1 Tax=Blattamonas nauphoetae TaxID=2049346 RepID=A0ABQ9XT05_9EUKA|nr:hypothetical protein BLNAU_10764 [Blattamonas nauphoetae]
MDSFSVDCSAFLNWSEDQQQSDEEQAVVYQSLVATMKLQPALDVSLEEKAVEFLESVNPYTHESADVLLNNPGRTTHESLTDFVHQVITAAAMKMLDCLIWSISARVHFALVKADLFPQLVSSLNPQSLSFAEAVDIHTDLLNIINQSLWLATPRALTYLKIEDGNEQQAVHETVFTQVLVPSELGNGTTQGGKDQQIGKEVYRMLRMEGMDDVTEQKLLNEESATPGQVILQPALDASLEGKAVRFLESVGSHTRTSADAFLGSFGQTTNLSSTNFMQSIVVLVSATSQTIITAAMNILVTLIEWCSVKVRLALVKADLIPQLVSSLNPQSLSFAEAVDIHVPLMSNIRQSVWLATPDGLTQLGIEDGDEQQAVHETVLKQVMVPSEKYLRHLCVNRYSIIDEELSNYFLILLARIIELCPYHQPTMDFVLHMPVFLTNPSYLTFFENDEAIYYCQALMIDKLQDWNIYGDQVQQIWNTVDQMLRMEGIEDVIDQKLGIAENEYGSLTVAHSITWYNLLGMNLPE